MTIWKVLFWICAILLVMDFLRLPFSDNIEVYDFIGLIIGSIFLIPYYGYSYQKAIGWKVFWQFGFIVNLVIISFVIYDPFIINALYKPEIVDFVAILFVLILSVFFFIPMYRYAFSSEHLWVKGI